MPQRKSRYSNVRKHIAFDGTKLDSGAELKRYLELNLLEQAGKIRRLCVHKRYPITIGGVDVKYPNGRHMVFVGDFEYLDLETGWTVIEDVKMQSGHLTDVFKIKRALMAAMGKPITEIR